MWPYQWREWGHGQPSGIANLAQALLNCRALSTLPKHGWAIAHPAHLPFTPLIRPDLLYREIIVQGNQSREIKVQGNQSIGKVKCRKLKYREIKAEPLKRSDFSPVETNSISNSLPITHCTLYPCFLVFKIIDNSLYCFTFTFHIIRLNIFLVQKSHVFLELSFTIVLDCPPTPSVCFSQSSLYLSMNSSKLSRGL